jgi:ribonuclease PH
MNLVMTGKGRFVEIQGTAEKTPFSSEQLQQLLSLGSTGINQLVEIQREALGSRSDLKRLFPILT